MAHLVQERLRAAGVSLVLHVKTTIMQRIARATQGIVLQVRAWCKE